MSMGVIEVEQEFVGALARPVNVPWQGGVHMRVAASIMSHAKAFKASVLLVSPENKANAKSILELLAMGATNGKAIILTAKGPDAAEAMEDISSLFDAPNET